MSLIQFENVNYIYGVGTTFEKQALKNICFTVESGSFIGLIGHTGSGKSTLIQHMNGLIRPTSGKIYFHDEDITADGYKKKELRSKVGIVFQYPEYQIFEETVYKDIAFGPKNMRLSEHEIDRRVRQTAAAVGISEELLGKSPFELSGGEKRRVAIAGVMAMEPEVLILDEPTAGLDPKGRGIILEQIKEYHRNMGCTVLLVSHSMEDVAQYASRILVVNGGKIVFDDKPRKVFEHEKELHEMGLAIPQVTQLMHRLKSEGYPVFENAITVQEARKNLLMYFQGKKKQDCKSKDQNNQDQKSQIESRRKPEEKTV